MTDLYFFILTAINLFILIFMCGLVKLSETLNPKQAKGFLATFILIGGISILEMISVLVDDGPVWLRWLNVMSNYLGFGLTPVVPICLAYTLERSERMSWGGGNCGGCRNSVSAGSDGLPFLQRTGIYGGCGKSLFQTEGVPHLHDHVLCGNYVFAGKNAGDGAKLSKSWEGADLWPDWVSGSGNSGPGADSIGTYYLALCHAQCGAVFSVLQ